MSEVFKGSRLSVGGLDLLIEYRELGLDGGPCLHLLQPTEGGSARQLIRFDLFRGDPHYHFDPEGRNWQVGLDAESTEEAVEWAVNQLAVNLRGFLEVAGFVEVANSVDMAEMRRLAPRIRQLLLHFSPDGAEAGSGAAD